jgi:hypothetical protein
MKVLLTKEGGMRILLAREGELVTCFLPFVRGGKVG